ncbi:MAG TPA: RNA polymerase sigma-54 factor [Bacteroidetes bacterium]|nr:RNA polymerase sigma-54 factor [Bacteroidota bacterium]
MKLLQIPTAVLEQRIQEELEANPALEEGDEYEEEDELTELLRAADEKEKEEEENEVEEIDDLERDELPPEEEVSLDEYLTDYMDDDEASYKTRGDNYNPDEEQKTLPLAVEETFHEYLEQQLGMLDFKSEREQTIALQIIGSIDDDGYLRRDIDAILDDLLFSQGVTATKEEIEYWLSRIQHFDPPGIGARNLQECLLIQIDNKLAKEDVNNETKRILKVSRKIISHHFDEFTKKHYQRMQRQLGLKEEELKEAIDEILKLNPKPASGHYSSNRNVHYIVPDFIIINNDGELELSLNTRNAPDLHINNHYRDMLRNYKATTKGRRATKNEKEAIMFIKQKIDSAKWFIDAIRQRQQTMFNTMYAIMNYQQDFFLTGDQKTLRPMILKDIADITGLDISTVSRVANSKFVQTEFGTKRLKDFFSESLQTQDGEEVSTLEVKKILTDIIKGENKRKPYSDEKLKNLLREKGYNIARRTVAKYREQLNIPVARLRKEL